jgi:membrane-associated PAP2 superfamily phosphatase
VETSSKERSAPAWALTWALCAAAGGSGPGKCDPDHCVCGGEASAVLVALRMSGWDVVPKMPWFYAAIAGIVLVILAAFGLGYWLG